MFLMSLTVDSSNCGHNGWQFGLFQGLWLDPGSLMVKYVWGGKEGLSETKGKAAARVRAEAQTTLSNPNIHPREKQ